MCGVCECACVCARQGAQILGDGLPWQLTFVRWRLICTVYRPIYLYIWVLNLDPA